MTITTITTQLDKINADASYEVDNNTINLTIDDFGGFDENWCEIEREFTNEQAIDEVLEWLEQNADEVEGDYCRCYRFGEIEVELAYASMEI